MLAVIAVDDCKLSIFKCRLKEAGFEIMNEVKLGEETFALRVSYTTETFKELRDIVYACQAEANRLGRTN